MKTHQIYPVAAEDLYLYYKLSLSLYRILPMQLVIEYSCQLGFYQMIHCQVMIWWIETMIECWEQEVQIQTLMKGNQCYTTRDNTEVKLRNAIVVVSVSTQTHQTCIQKYCDLHYWWTEVAWYLTVRMNSDLVLKKLATHVLCYVKIWMTVDGLRTAELD